MKRLPLPQRLIGVVLVLCCCGTVVLAQQSQMSDRRNETMQQLAREFFTWRAGTQPCTPDDIPRVERPAGWAPDFSPKALSAYRKTLATFSRRLEALPAVNWSRSDSVDYLLLRSALERVRWELELFRLPQRDPDFYVQQTLGSVYELLVLSSPMTANRIAEMVLRLRAIPGIVRDAELNLTAPVAAFSRTALSELDGVRGNLDAMDRALSVYCEPERYRSLHEAVANAATALDEFDVWMRARLPRMDTSFGPGRALYMHYLHSIALVPFTTEQMLAMGQSEYDRSVTFEALEANRNGSLSPPKIFGTTKEQIERCGKDELAIRAFLQDHRLLTIPDWVGHYGNRALPSYLLPLAPIGMTDDLTSERRRGQNAVAYIPPPGPELSYFRKASAQDPRPIIIHEGVPGHFFQMSVSWANEDPIRRHYFDSGPIEGWGFYVEELMLQEGLFDNDRPQTREIIYNFMRLRALRVEVDIRLALGEFSLDQAADYLSRLVPMDHATAEEEARFFAATPGQAISYQIGKLQIEKFLADARTMLGDRFDLRDFHDYVVRNGNVPIALQRWEYLGVRDEIDRLWPEAKNDAR
jgi:hypothetical protein